MIPDPPAAGASAELRRLFDQSFAVPWTDRDAHTDDMVLIAAGGHPYAIRIGEISGMVAGVSPAWLPTSVPGLLGLATVRAAVVPIYDLRAVLGLPAPAMPLPWIMLVGDGRLGLATERYEGHRRVPRQALVQVEDTARNGYVGEIAHVDGAARSVLAIPAVVRAVEERCRREAGKER